MSHNLASLLRRIFRSRLMLLASLLALVAAAVMCISIILSAAQLGFAVVLGTTMLFSLLTLISVRLDAATAKVARQKNSAKLDNIERLTSRAEWRAGEAFRELASNVNHIDSRTATQELKESVEALSNQIAMISSQNGGRHARISERDLELLLVSLLAKRNHGAH